jgi:ribosomal protein S12 methylthiotransferase accessory factor
MLNLSPIDLESPAGRELLNNLADIASPELVAIAKRVTRIFRIPSPFAPGFCCIGGEIALESDAASAYGMPRLSVTGNGETLQGALASCLGEAADFLSQIERKGDVEDIAIEPGSLNFITDGWIAAAIAGAGKAIEWIGAFDAATTQTALVPADICLRRPPGRRAIEPVGALSSGAAAGRDFESAALRAVLELCERDAAALWWLGGRRPKSFALEHPAAAAVAALIGRLRQGTISRRTSLLDITTDTGVPVVAAVSVDQDGRGLACGLSSRLSATEAAKAAILEMCQMEMAAPVADAKRAERGEAALNEADRRHLRRAAFAATDCELLHPFGVAAGAPSEAADTALEGLIGRLSRRGIRFFLVDHTRKDIGVSVARAVSPDLQPFAATPSTSRLARARSENGRQETTEMPTPLF